MEIGHGNVGVESFGLVDRQEQRFAAAARQLRHELILRRNARTTVHQYDEPIRLADRALGLRDHQTFDHVGVFNQAAGVHDDARNLGAPREPVLPVARKPRQIGNQSIAGAGHGIEQGRFAYIRSTDQCNYRQHDAYGDGGGVAGAAAGGGAGSATGGAGSAAGGAGSAAGGGGSAAGGAGAAARAGGSA